MPLLKRLLLWLALVTLGPLSAMAMGRWGCFGAGVAEAFVPGVGYGITGQWDKVLTISGPRRAFSWQYRKAIDSPYYQEDLDQVYQQETLPKNQEGIEKTRTRIYLNRETWDAQFYGGMSSDLFLVSISDLYMTGCQKSSRVYELAQSPFRFDLFYQDWMFWAPMAVLASNAYFFSDYQEVEYHLGRGLTERRLRQDSFPKYYLVGLGEEMFFRGTLQHAFYDIYRDRMQWSPRFSQYGAIFSQAVLFGLAHNGQGFSANSLVAFGFGVYQGFVFQRRPEDFNLETAIAIHAWWDIGLAYIYLNNASFREENQDVSLPLFSVGFGF